LELHRVSTTFIQTTPYLFVNQILLTEMFIFNTKFIFKIVPKHYGDIETKSPMVLFSIRNTLLDLSNPVK